MDKDIVSVAMEIILKAGDSRTLIQKAFAAAAQRDFEASHTHLTEAEQKLNEAHIVQTDIIQKAVRGEPVEINLMLIHAQDTIMTINSEYIIAEQMISLLEILLKKEETV